MYVSYKVMRLPLFIEHGINDIARVEYMCKHFALVRNDPKIIITPGVVGLTDVFIMLDYAIRNYSDFSDIVDELKNAPLARSFDERSSFQHDTCIVQRSPRSRTTPMCSSPSSLIRKLQGPRQWAHPLLQLHAPFPLR